MLAILCYATEIDLSNRAKEIAEIDINLHFAPLIPFAECSDSVFAYSLRTIDEKRRVPVELGEMETSQFLGVLYIVLIAITTIQFSLGYLTLKKE